MKVESEEYQNKYKKIASFMDYSIKQRAILNGIKTESYEKIEMNKLFSKNTFIKFKALFYKFFIMFKHILRDNLLKGIIKEKIILIGTGGHAKVILDIIRAQGKYEVIGCTSSNVDVKIFEGIRVFGTDEMLSVVLEKGISKAFVAIGNNKARKNISVMAKKIGFTLVNIIHPASVISSTASLKSGICVMPGTIVNTHTVVGEGVILNTNANIDHDCSVSDWAHIAPGASLAGSVCVGEGVFVGVGATIKPGISIGQWSEVGAGSVVVKDMPANVICYGVPADIKKNKNE